LIQNQILLANQSLMGMRSFGKMICGRIETVISNSLFSFLLQLGVEIHTCTSL